MGLTDVPSYVYRELRDNYDDRFWWRNRILHRIVGPFHLNVYPTRRGSIRVMDEDWDTLVVLDGCRADLFEAGAPLETYDDYRRVTSAGSATQEWTRQNFTGCSFGDTVYVTANPFVSRETSGAFHDVIEPWLTDFDETERTVRPASVTDAALAAHDEYPDKRVVVHYMQPHHPFVEAPDVQYHGWDIDDFEAWTEQKEETGLAEEQAGDHPHTPWEALYLGLVTEKRLREAYAANLDLVLASVDDLLADIEGRTVITSDHGNMFGERTWPVPLRVYGHPTGVRNPELVRVPWAVVDSGDRRELREAGTSATADVDSDVVEERLRDLGYA